MPLDIQSDIVRTGDKIIIPETITFRQAIEYLRRREREDDEEVDVNEVIKAHPADGALALRAALTERFGAPNTRAGKVQTFFGPMDVPPQTISVEVDFGKTEQVQWSGFKVPQIDGEMWCATMSEGNMLYFVLKGKVKRKHLGLVKQIADRTRVLASTKSIYRGKAIRLPTDEHGNVDYMNFRFIDLRNAGKERLIFSDSVHMQIQANLFTPLENTAACRANGIPLKRGVLLAGKYGTGKTETARAAASAAVANGWTFLLVERVGGLRAAIEIARMYAPCVVFAEDIDRAVAGDTRTVSIDDVLNIVDGVESKKDELLLVLTTNHVERINKAMLRPGRIDAVIEISPPDAAAVAKLMRLYCGELLSPGDKLEKSSARLAGQIPAVIAEVCRKAKLYAITRDPNNLVITDEDLDVAGEGMAAHFKLMQDAVEDTSNPATRLAGAFKAIVGDVVGDVLVGAEVIDQKPVLNS